VSQVRFRGLRRNKNRVAVVTNGNHVPLPASTDSKTRRIAEIVD
jgi:hypothetical protein